MKKNTEKNTASAVEKVVLEPTTVKHFANLGDIIAIMPALKEYHRVVGRKIKLCQMVNQPAVYYPGAVHPTMNEAGQNVCINDVMFDMIKPLIDVQEYIHSMVKYDGQRIDLDFDVIRSKTFVGMPNLMIQSWVMYAYPDLACDLSKAWMTLPKERRKYWEIAKQAKGKVILNFTERYRSEPVDYFFLRSYAPSIIFAGTEREHYLFCTRWNLNVPRLELNNFLEYAMAIQYSKFIMGNQSFGWNIAQAIQHPRMVELCRYAPNVQPMIGENSFGYFHQVAAEYYFRKLFNNESPDKWG